MQLYRQEIIPLYQAAKINISQKASLPSLPMHFKNATVWKPLPFQTASLPLANVHFMAVVA